jgi:hypothetical protein
MGTAPKTRRHVVTCSTKSAIRACNSNSQATRCAPAEAGTKRTGNSHLPILLCSGGGILYYRAKPLNSQAKCVEVESCSATLVLSNTGAQPRTELTASLTAVQWNNIISISITSCDQAVSTVEIVLKNTMADGDPHRFVPLSFTRSAV